MTKLSTYKQLSWPPWSLFKGWWNDERITLGWKHETFHPWCLLLLHHVAKVTDYLCLYIILYILRIYYVGEILSIVFHPVNAKDGHICLKERFLINMQWTFRKYIGLGGNDVIKEQNNWKLQRICFIILNHFPHSNLLYQCE